MAHHRYRRTLEHKAVQKVRTRKNKRIKYEKLIATEPDNKDIDVWKKKLTKVIS